MTELTPSAQDRLDDYIHELHRVLSGAPSVDTAEVERDVRDHIEAALAGHDGPVEVSVLDDVLRTLGSPAQWLPEGEPAWFRRSISEWPAIFKESIVRTGKRLAGGPESYRLAYLSLLILGLGWYLMPRGRFDAAIYGPMISTIISFFLSRAALSLFGADRLSTGRKWLLYPALLAVYLPVAALIFLGPVAIVGLHAIKGGDDFGNAATLWIDSQSPIKMTCGLVAVAGASWFLIGLLWTLLPGLARHAFYPFVATSSRRIAFAMAILGLLMSFGGVLFFL